MWRRSWSYERLFLLAELIQSLLHLVELALEFVHLAARTLRFFRRFRLTACKRGEHGESLFEHLHISPDLILERPKCTDAKSLRHLFAEFALFLRQRFNRSFQKTGHQHLHTIAVKADQLPQEGDRQEALSFLVFLFEDDLRKHRARNVFAGFCVVDDEILAVLDHRCEVFERHIGTRSGIIEPPVCILFDGDRLFFFLCHVDHTFSPAQALSIANFRSYGPAVLWHRGSAVRDEASLAERPKKRQLSGIFDWQVMLTDPHGLPRMRQCQIFPPAPERDATGVSYERRHRHRERYTHPGWRIQWGICQSAGP